LCFLLKSSTKAAAAAMHCEHSPNGGIQWLLEKPWMCSIGNVPRIVHRIRMVIEITINLPSFFIVVDFLFAHNRRC
jgi:hypothetical protein